MAASDEQHDMLERVVHELERSAVPDEALATVKRGRIGSLEFGPVKLVPAGRAWRLGVILIDRQARLYSSGEVTRAVEPQRGVANKSLEAEERREWRRAAVRGRFGAGEVVNFGYELLDPASGVGPVTVADGILMVAWNPSATPRPLEGYLAERIALLHE